MVYDGKLDPNNTLVENSTGTALTEVPLNSPNGIATLDGGGKLLTSQIPLINNLYGFAVSSIPPTDGYVLTWVNVNTEWEPKPIPIQFIAGGDLSGNNISQNVINIHGASVPIAGALTIGNALQVIGPSTLSYGPINLSGGNNFISGTLPIGNQDPQNIFGDVTGTTAAATVVKLQGNSISAISPRDGYVLTWVNSNNDWEPQSIPIQFIANGDLSGTATNQNVINIHGASVPIAGALITGNVLQVSGSSSLTYGPINLAGGINYVTGILPEINQAAQTMGGDISGTTNAATVTKLQNFSVSAVAPTDGYVLTWSTIDNSWEPLVTFIAGGDLFGTKTNQTVTGIQTYPVANTVPFDSAVLVYSTVNSKYNIRQLTLDDVLPAFAITSFTGGSNVEVGTSVINPSFNASYSSPATSAQITNTDNIDSPLILSSPFTSGTVIGTFVHNNVTSVVFTLQAVAATTKTATTNINYYARSFVGIGTANATGATASGNNAILTGASGTLNNNGIQSTVIGLTTSTLSPSSQKIYFLCVHTTTPHQFKDQNGFSFAMNSPTVFSFTNQNGSVLSYDLYESTNLLSTSFTLTVVS